MIDPFCSKPDPPETSCPAKECPGGLKKILNTENTSELAGPFDSNCIFCQILASRAKCEFTTGRVPCLNQSNDFASLDLSVLF